MVQLHIIILIAYTFIHKTFSKRSRQHILFTTLSGYLSSKIINTYKNCQDFLKINFIKEIYTY